MVPITTTADTKNNNNEAIAILMISMRVMLVANATQLEIRPAGSRQPAHGDAQDVIVTSTP